MDRYTADSIKSAVSADEEKLFESWSVGRPIGWKCDSQVKDSVCIGNWIMQELSRLVAEGFIGPDGIVLSDDDRRAQQQMFNRWMRSRVDLFELASEVMNEVVDGTIVRDRISHKRWG